MKYSQMSKNYIFRKFTCNLSKKDTANLCFKNTSDVKKWDNGSNIPPVYKRLMRMQSGRELSSSEEWKGFRMENNYFILPTGKALKPQEILTAVALLEISSELELKTTAKLVKIARAITNIPRK